MPAAQAASEPAADPQELETVMVYARRLTPLTEVAATVTVIDAVRIDATLASDLRDMVRYEPGVSVRSDPFRFGLDTISIRGLGGNRVAVEIDGIPVAPGFAVGSYADSGRSFVDPLFVERAEIMRGPASALYGSDAIGGVLAMTTWSPRDLLGPEPSTAALRTTAGYDGVDDGWSAAAIGAAAAGPGNLLLCYARREGSATDTAAAVQPDPREYTSDSVLAKYELDGMPGGPLTLALDAARLTQETSVDAFLGVPGRFVNTTLLLGDDTLERARISLAQQIGPGHAAFDSAQWRLYWQSTRTDQDTYEERRAVPPRTPAVQLERSFEFDEDVYGFEFSAVHELTSGAVRHDVTYGIELERSSLAELRDGLQTSLPSGATTNVILGEEFPLRDLPLTDLTEAGVFVQDQIAPSGDARWTVVPALRVDWYRLEPRADRIYREDNPTVAPVGVDDVSFAPKLGATWRVAEAVTLFGQYAHGYRAPPPEDVNIGLELPLFRVRAVPNPDLSPERSDGFELGVRVDSAALALSASVFDTEYRDFIESKVNLGVDPATGYTLFQSQNVAEARIYGAEVAATARLDRIWPRLAGLSGRLAAAWMQGRDLTRDVPLNSVEPPSAVLGVKYDAPDERWGVELALTAVEAQREVDRSRADLYRTDGYATLDLLARWQFTPRLRLNVALFNLTDEAYVEWADVRGRIVGDPLLPYYTQPGFNASVALRYEL
jgi:hemoglobin/transferrin/lactoferrin receptor protein